MHVCVSVFTPWLRAVTARGLRYALDLHIAIENIFAIGCFGYIRLNGREKGEDLVMSLLVKSMSVVLLVMEYFPSRNNIFQHRFRIIFYIILSFALEFQYFAGITLTATKTEFPVLIKTPFNYRTRNWSRALNFQRFIIKKLPNDVIDFLITIFHPSRDT